MKIKRVPTNIIKEMAKTRNVKHLFGYYWLDKDYHCILKGDKKFKKMLDK